MSPGDSPLDIARAMVGVREASGRNDGPLVEEFLGGASERGLAWCAAFILRVHEWAGRPLHRTPAEFYRWRAVDAFENGMKERGLWLPKTTHPKPGWVVFFRGAGTASGRHVGMVERVESPTLHTIEGNLSNAVRRASHDLFSERITGYGHHT